jgi:hypothetical protein
MGQIIVEVVISNLADIIRGRKIRKKEANAIADSGARMMSIPRDLALLLGLEIVEQRKVRYADGSVAMKDIGSDVEVFIPDLNRKTNCRVLIEDPGAPVLLGQIPMEDMDVVVNLAEERLTVNPESPYAPLATQY